LIESYRSETASKEKQIIELSDVSLPEVFQVTRCAACGGQLDLPSVHFMCKHSYHQRYVSPNPKSEKLMIGVCPIPNLNVSCAHASIPSFVKLDVVRRDWQIDMICSWLKFMRLKMDLGLSLVRSGVGSWVGNQRPSRP